MPVLNIFVRNGHDTQVRKILESLRKSRHKNIRVWMESALSRELPFRNWKDKYIIDDSIGSMPHQYFEWKNEDCEVLPLTYDLRGLWWHWVEEQQDFCLIQNPLSNKRQIVLFEDSATDTSFPKCFKIARCFNDYDSLMNYCRAKGIVKFCLSDQNLFRHEHDIHIVKGAEVYREIATDRLWYRDTLHKDHYEVFSSDGRRHIAEADLEGHVEFSKADPSKHPIR